MSADADEPGTLHDRIKHDLRAMIARGEYAADVPFITQRQVCERYGVSTTTAVRALNELVADGLLVRRRGKGTFVAEQTPHHPTDRSDRSGRAPAPTIACIVQGLFAAHVAQLARGVESVCAELGYRMVLSDSDASSEREASALRQALETGAAGVVLYPVEGQANLELLDDLRRQGTPIVFVDRYHADFPTDAVLADNFAIGYELTKHLIERGHERIGTLWSETHCTSVGDRLSGHAQALREHGLPVRPELTVLRSYWPNPKQLRRTILSRLMGGDKPTVVLCVNGYVLAQAAIDLLELGVAIPDEVDLASMDDAGPYDILPLSAVAAALPSYAMGQRAMRMLADRIGTADPYRGVQHVVLPVEIRSREAASAYLRAVSSTPD
ncbi:GntR family transcriptional regulator [Tenggerimyces flavus]|uniref:Substrate-binding domain-containing protein n=1 Tax=Tenggerimyces flavus TaxID=1708749 RepID=A0ABV7YJZ3_9ACTN|nr:GntR family transcriptional regulator [Tenggerimyces flavus]MBM7784808.1 DNA-binding LacI/PurR family transcriptional regulator [Tenggerimyces flavus]